VQLITTSRLFGYHWYAYNWNASLSLAVCLWCLWCLRLLAVGFVVVLLIVSRWISVICCRLGWLMALPFYFCSLAITYIVSLALSLIGWLMALPFCLCCLCLRIFSFMFLRFALFFPLFLSLSLLLCFCRFRIFTATGCPRPWGSLVFYLRSSAHRNYSYWAILERWSASHRMSLIVTTVRMSLSDYNSHVTHCDYNSHVVRFSICHGVAQSFSTDCTCNLLIHTPFSTRHKQCNWSQGLLSQ